MFSLLLNPKLTTVFKAVLHFWEFFLRFTREPSVHFTPNK
uniref:Uncharacterized protein n=1 Tax=Arundo donax TaxID=35708 RepID=A0A0A8YU29_ARUDO